MTLVFPVPELPAQLSLEDRNVISATIERLIDILDRIDGDPDLEDDDPAGGSIDDERQDDPDGGLWPAIYGVDQSEGPINTYEVNRAYSRAPHEDEPVARVRRQMLVAAGQAYIARRPASMRRGN